MQLKFICRIIWGTLASVAVFGQAQFKVTQQTNFEQNSLGTGVFTIGAKIEEVAQVVDLAKIQGLDSNFFDGETAQQLGRYALKLRANPPDRTEQTYINGIGLSEPIDRDQLGEDGQVLFQADFYIPAGAQRPNLALLALEPPTAGVGSSLPGVTGRYYRYGFTVNKVSYFSFVEPNQAKPTLYLHDRPMNDILPSGWHRFAMLVGKIKISCFIDGREAIFTPMGQTSLRKLVFGVLLSEAKLTYDAYVDNVSVQISEGAGIRLPDSPYTAGWTVPPGSAARLQAADPGPSAERDFRWMEPEPAWQKSQQTGKPLLFFFCKPGLANSDRIDKLFYELSDANRFLGNHVPARIDVTLARNSEIAQKYGVFRTPTLITIAPDGKTYKRTTPVPSENWEKIAKDLELND